MKSLKTLIKRNLDKRFPLTDAIRLSTLLDPTTKNLVNEMSEADKEELIYSAVAAVQEQPSNNQPNEIDSATSSSASLSQFANASDSNANASTCSYLPTTSKKLKFVRKHAPQYQQDSRLRDDIKNYLRYLPTDNEDDPLNFWRHGLFPSLQAAAKRCLSRSASSAPVENIFSTMGIILNGKRSTLAPYRANWLSFIHDNFKLFG